MAMSDSQEYPLNSNMETIVNFLGFNSDNSSMLFCSWMRKSLLYRGTSEENNTLYVNTKDETSETEFTLKEIEFLQQTLNF